MSSSDSKPKAGVPSWQLKKTEEAETDKSATTEASTDDASRTELVESAKKFLEEDEVKDATTDKKISFLESKGLNSEEIEKLLGVSRNVEASSAVTKTPPTPQPSQKPVAVQPAPSPVKTAVATAQPSYQPQQDTPPIITYPEFLTTPTAPPPLITPSRVANTLYAFGGLGALIYGASTYLVKPMTDALTGARHELHETAQERLNTFNEKLRPIVSEIPQPHLAHGEAYADKEDDSDSDSDPTEMFHRDIGVQTSDELPTPPEVKKEPAALVHASKASTITTLLNDVDLSMSSETHEITSIQTEINSLKTYLDGLMYTAPTFTYGAGTAYGVKRDDTDDEIGRLKKEIRAVKGVLLSARSFPGVGSAARRVPA